MKLSGSQIFQAPRSILWSILINPESLARISPGISQLVPLGNNQFRAITIIKIGPVKGSFSGMLEIKDKEEPKSFSIEAKQNGKIGNASVAVKVGLDRESFNSTLITFEGKAQLSGSLARTGQRVLSGVAHTITKQFFSAVELEIDQLITQNRSQMGHQITVTINGKKATGNVDSRTLLVHFIREHLELTGTHIGCDTSGCGACTILLDGHAVKSCTILAVQADGHEILTVEGLAVNGSLHPVQEGFHEEHGLQCGFCTPGMMMTALDLLSRNPNPDDSEIRKALEGNFCRCTGYHNIVKSIKYAAQKMHSLES